MPELTIAGILLDAAFEIVRAVRAYIAYIHTETL